MVNRRLFLGSMVASGAMAGVPSLAQAEESDAIVALAEHMSSRRFEDIPAAVLNVTRAELLDAVGVGLAARNESGVRELRELSASVGGKGESVVWGSALRLPSHDAARINATMVHALEYDDTFGRGYLHPSTITFPAALAVADMVGHVSGQEFLTATTLAIDIACRMALAGQPGVDGFAIGWHNTTLNGYLSSALLAGRLMGLDRDQLVNAAGIAAHQAGGNAQSHIDSAITKRMGPGFASATGIFAARLAAKGVAGPRGVLEGKKGWFAQYHKGNYSRSLLLGELGSSFPNIEMAFKPWPSCRGSHNSVDAALQLIDKHGLRPEMIERISLRNGPGEWPFLCNPIERKRQPTTVVDAQFSIPWAVAAAFTDGKVSISHFTLQALGRQDIKAMAQRIVSVQDDALANPHGGPGQAVVEVTTRDGQNFRQQVVAAKGDPGNPMTATEVSKKFDDCIAYAGIDAARGVRIRQVLGDIDRLDTMSRLTEALSV